MKMEKRCTCLFMCVPRWFVVHIPIITGERVESGITGWVIHSFWPRFVSMQISDVPILRKFSTEFKFTLFYLHSRQILLMTI